MTDFSVQQASKLIELSLTLAGLKHAVLHRERSVT